MMCEKKRPVLKYPGSKWRMADMDGCRDVGRIVDKLTREKMLSLHVGKRERLRG